MAIRTLLITVRRNPKLTTALIVRGLPGEKGDKGDQGEPGEGVSAYADIEALPDYPETFPPESHTHPVEQVTGVLPVEKGGTGATSASAARTALGLGTTDSPTFGPGGNWTLGADIQANVPSGSVQISSIGNFRFGGAGPRILASGSGIMITLSNNSTLTSLLCGNLTSSGDVEITDATKGVILKSPDGTRYRVTVANGGTLQVSAV